MKEKEAWLLLLTSTLDYYDNTFDVLFSKRDFASLCTLMQNCAVMMRLPLKEAVKNHYSDNETMPEIIAQMREFSSLALTLPEPPEISIQEISAIERVVENCNNVVGRLKKKLETIA